MKIINITNGAFAALLMASSVAGADAQYPASDFQPKVLYQDSEYKHQGSSSAAAAPSSAKPADSQYPASDFQPKVVYSDPSYKASSSSETASSSRPQNKSVESSSAAASQPAASAAVEEAKPAAEAKKEESNFVYLIGLAVLAFVGVVFFKKQARPEGHAAQAAARAAVGGATGVAKYLSRKAGTGVSRYLEQQVKSATASAPLTGVAKYMASQKPSAESASSKPASRVEKYLRDRG
ncbi:hypothetical protein [Methylomicrobium lacus]|uniref:hypothetical protein n=1 Tax=Methylomicrobium lacus TaxID=136992 RepID=UPI0035A89569